jgi:Winged helix DNA-binding domain
VVTNRATADETVAGPDEPIPYTRMRNLRLTGPPLDDPQQIIGWLGAVQAQDYGPAKWALAQRGNGLTDRSLDRLFAAGAILRTHVLRPTWHFVRPADIRWLLELTGPRVHVLNAHMYRQVGLDAAGRAKSEAVIAGALRGGNHLTRNELAEVLERAGISARGFRLAYILMSAELNGTICSGPLRGKQHTYALLDERVPRTEGLTRDAALAELTLRYFTSHGPATGKDFRTWSSLTVPDVGAGLEMVASRLQHADVDGTRYWFAGPWHTEAPPSPSVYLLQGYDEYFMGYTESKYLVDLSGVARMTSGDRPIFNHVVLLDSQVVGHWRRTVGKGSVSIEAALYRPFNRCEAAALQRAAEKHAEFLELPGSLLTRALPVAR